MANQSTIGVKEQVHRDLSGGDDAPTCIRVLDTDERMDRIYVQAGTLGHGLATVAVHPPALEGHVLAPPQDVVAGTLGLHRVARRNPMRDQPSLRLLATLAGLERPPK